MGTVRRATQQRVYITLTYMTHLNAYNDMTFNYPLSIILKKILLIKTFKFQKITCTLKKQTQKIKKAF